MSVGVSDSWKVSGRNIGGAEKGVVMGMWEEEEEKDNANGMG